MVKKLILKRDCDRYNSFTGQLDPPKVRRKDNEKTVENFLKNVITKCGFSPRKRIETDFDGTVRVYIKELGGKFYLQAQSDYVEAGGNEEDDEIEIREFILGNDVLYDFDCIDYTSYKNMIQNLPKDLNRSAGENMTLKKTDARKAS